MVRVANFNVENLFSRFSILNLDTKTRKRLETDFDNFSMTNKTRKGQELIQLKREPISEVAQQNTARIIDLVNADVICLQEVEDLPTLRNFAQKVLSQFQKTGHKKYEYFMAIDGNDDRGIDVAIMSRYPFGNIKTHMFDEDPVTRRWLFSRDCLEIDVLVNGHKLHFLINHFKSKITSGKDTNGINKRTRQAEKVAQIVKELAAIDPNGNYVVAGDLNDTPNSKPLKSLFASDVGLYNTMKEEPSSSNRWTYIHGSKKQQLDYLLVSNNLKSKIKDFGIERSGLSRSKTAYKGDRLPTVQKDGTEASDHCAIYFDFDI